MVILVFVCLVTALLAVAYASFTTGVLCARDRHLRPVFIRVMALLGVIALGGASVMALRAEAPGDAAQELMDQLTDVESLMAVEKVDASVTDVPATLEECGSQQDFDLRYPTEVELAALQASYIAPRPDWIAAPLFNKGTGDHWTSVSSGPWVTQVEAKTALEENIYEAVVDYVDDQIGRRGAARRIHITAEDIRRSGIVKHRYAEEDEFSVGVMHLEHAKLVFTPQFRSNIGGTGGGRHCLRGRGAARQRRE